MCEQINKYEEVTEADWQAINEFDWDISRLKVPKGIDYRTRKELMLRALNQACHACVMCNLCENTHEKGREIDPHVFSNMKYSRWLVVGQNPGHNECLDDEPFVGEAGRIFDDEIAKYRYSRDQFYITNVVKCHSIANALPDSEKTEKCRPFISMELNILKPILVITLGALAFRAFFKGELAPNLNKVMKCKFAGMDLKVFPIYHPSPRNMQLAARRKKFEEGIRLVCKLRRKLGS